MDKLEEAAVGDTELNTIALWDLEYGDDIVLLAQSGASTADGWSGSMHWSGY